MALEGEEADKYRSRHHRGAMGGQQGVHYGKIGTKTKQENSGEDFWGTQQR